jgi:hypothetical protein
MSSTTIPTSAAVQTGTASMIAGRPSRFGRPAVCPLSAGAAARFRKRNLVNGSLGLTRLFYNDLSRRVRG